MSTRREGKKLHIQPPDCALCDDQSVAYCRTCGKHFCFVCTAGHKKQKASKDHDMYDIDFDQSSVDRATCLRHLDQDVGYFCETCVDVCCQQCVSEDHRSHKYKPMEQVTQKVKNLCLDKIKSLSAPCDALKTKVSLIESSNTLRMKQYDEVKREIADRKTNLITLITNIADEEVADVKLKQTDEDHFAKSIKSEVTDCIKRSEAELAPVMSVVLGNDVNSIVRCLQGLHIQTERCETLMNQNDAMQDLESVRVTDAGETMDLVTDIINKYLKVEVSKPNNTFPKKASPTPYATPNKTNDNALLVSPKTTLQPDLTLPSERVTQNKVRDINKAVLVRQFEMNDITMISKYIDGQQCICHDNESTKVITYDMEGTTLTKTRLICPKPRNDFGRSILTITKANHILVSDKGIHLCDKAGVTRTRNHDPDKYIPDIISYVNRDTFASYCSEQKSIRFHDTKTLETISTHPLQSDSKAKIEYKDLLFLASADQDILVRATYNKEDKLLRFTNGGTMKGIVPVPKEFFDCVWYTVCLVCENKMLAAKHDGSIYCFTLKGDHKVIGNIPDTTCVWNIGVDGDHIYVSYFQKSVKNFIAKYVLS